MTKLNRERATAYHEAGHAVIALRLERRIKSATIVPRDNYLGCVQYGKWGRGQPDAHLTQRVVEKLERDILCAFAGPVAEAKFTGRRNKIGASGDYQIIVDRATYLHGDDRVLEKYLVYMEARAACYVSEPVNWLCITRLAKTLLKQKTMSSDAVLQALQDAQADYFDRLQRRQTKKGTHDRINSRVGRRVRRPQTLADAIS